MYVCMYEYIYVYTYLSIYVCMHVSIYPYTQVFFHTCIVGICILCRHRVWCLCKGYVIVLSRNLSVFDFWEVIVFIRDLFVDPIMDILVFVVVYRRRSSPSDRILRIVVLRASVPLQVSPVLLYFDLLIVVLDLDGHEDNDWLSRQRDQSILPLPPTVAEGEQDEEQKQQQKQYDANNDGDDVRDWEGTKDLRGWGK